MEVDLYYHMKLDEYIQSCFIYSKDSGLNHKKHRGFRIILIKVTNILSAECDSIIYSMLSSVTGGNISANISVSSTWPVCAVFLRPVITCSHRVYFEIQLALRRWVIWLWSLIIFVHKFPAVYDKWTIKTEGNANDLRMRVVNSSALYLQTFIHHYQLGVDGKLWHILRPRHRYKQT